MKDFDSWNKEKKNLEIAGKDSLIFHEREIWWCSIGFNLGDEQDGKNDMFERPILIIKKFNNRVAWVLPMSTKEKDGIYYHKLNYDGKIYSAILSQIRLISVKRFRRYIRKISPNQYRLIKLKLVNFLK